MEDNWISCEEKRKLPKTDREVLVYAPECNIIGSVLIGRYFLKEKSWSVYDFGQTKVYENVTHWQPLPKPPKQIKQ